MSLGVGGWEGKGVEGNFVWREVCGDGSESVARERLVRTLGRTRRKKA